MSQSFDHNFPKYAYFELLKMDFIVALRRIRRICYLIRRNNEAAFEVREVSFVSNSQVREMHLQITQ